MKRYGFICALVLVLMALAIVPVFAQEEKGAAAPAEGAAVSESEAPAAVETAAPEAGQPKDVSIYGEVLSVNAAANTMSVQYYDYDSDEEKTVELSVGADTKLENAASLNDVKKGDWVDAIYSSVGGKNAAKSVMVEKEEAVQMPENAPAAETTEPVQQ